MAEETVLQAAPETQVNEQPSGNVLEPKREDLISRVSKVKIEPKKEEVKPSNEFGITEEDYNKIQTDPSLSKLYKSMQAGFTKKTQEAADIRKKAEEQLRQSSTWSVERLRNEVSKPDFIEAAKIYAAQQNPPNSGLTDQEYSALTDKEKEQLRSTTEKVHQLEMQNWQMQQKQQDEQLKQKYSNYAPDIVDVTITKLVNKEAIASREDVWKVIDYDDAIKRAYQLGLDDRKLTTEEKQHAASFEGVTVTPNKEAPAIEKGESNSQFFKRIATKRLAEANQARQTK